MCQALICPSSGVLKNKNQLDVTCLNSEYTEQLEVKTGIR